jgi:hypothetical protein
MSTEVEQIMQKVRSLTPEQQREILRFVETIGAGTELRKTIEEKIKEHAKEVPDEVWEQIPADGAEQHDHYLYGTPKR